MIMRPAAAAAACLLLPTSDADEVGEHVVAVVAGVGLDRRAARPLTTTR